MMTIVKTIASALIAASMAACGSGSEGANGYYPDYPGVVTINPYTKYREISGPWVFATEDNLTEYDRRSIDSGYQEISMITKRRQDSFEICKRIDTLISATSADPANMMLDHYMRMAKECEYWERDYRNNHK